METFRSQVFKRAHEIARSTGKTFAICLVKAWQIYRLKKQMLKGTVKFAFEKVDGTIRYAYGTLEQKFLGDVQGLRKPNPKVVNYYDMEKLAFRCFRADNLVRIY